MQIDLSWETDLVDLEKLEIYRGTAPLDISNLPVAHFSTTNNVDETRKYTDIDGLRIGQTYYYRIALTQRGSTVISEEVRAEVTEFEGSAILNGLKVNCFFDQYTGDGRTFKNQGIDGSVDFAFLQSYSGGKYTKETGLIPSVRDISDARASTALYTRQQGAIALTPNPPLPSAHAFTISALMDNLTSDRFRSGGPHVFFANPYFRCVADFSGWLGVEFEVKNEDGNFTKRAELSFGSSTTPFNLTTDDLRVFFLVYERGGITLYLNYHDPLTVDVPHEFISGTLGGPTTQLRLNQGNSGDSAYVTGYRYWDRALTQAEVNALRVGYRTAPSSSD